MKFPNRIFASFLICIILITNSVSAKSLNRSTLFSDVTYQSNESIFVNPSSLWRVAQGDRIPTFTTSKFLSSLSKGRASSLVFRNPGKHLVYSTEMGVGSGKVYQFSDFIRSDRASSLIVRIRWQDNTSTRYKIASLPAFTQWNEVRFQLNAPEGALSYAVIHEIVGAGKIELGSYGSTDLSQKDLPLKKVDGLILDKLNTKHTQYSGGSGGGGGSSVYISVPLSSTGSSSGSGSSSGTGSESGTGSSSGSGSSSGTGSESGTGSSSGSGSSSGTGSESGTGSSLGSGSSSGTGSESGTGSSLGSGSSSGTGSESGTGSSLGSGSSSGTGSESGTGSSSGSGSSSGTGSESGTGTTGTGYTCQASLVINACIEDESAPGIPNGWNQGGFGTNTSLFTYPSEGNHGSGINLLISAYTDGDSKWFFNEVAVTAGSGYNYSVQYKSDAPSKLTVRYTTSTGGYIYDDIASLDPAASWTQVEKVLIVPTDVSSLTMFHVLAQVGNLSVDEAYLTLRESATGTGSTGSGSTGSGSTGTGSTGTGSGFPCPTNVIANPCMEIESSPGVPSGWNQGTYGDNTTLFTYPAEGNHDRGLNLLVSAYTDGDSKWYFNDVSVNAGDSYRYSVEYKSDAPSKLTARFSTASGEVQYEEIANLPVASAWTHFEQLIPIPEGIATMTIFHTLAQVGSLSIDEALLSDPIFYTGTPFSSPMLTFSFDDGWLSQKINAIPVLDAKGYKGTFGIITNEMQNADTELPEDQVYMNTAETLALQTSGHEIASHTVSHANLPTLDASGMTDEIVNSRNILLGSGFAPVGTIVFPYGEHSPQVDQISQDAGYTAGRDDAYGYNTKDTAKFGLYVQNVGSGTSLTQVQGWIDRAYDNNLWLILMLHQVDNSGFDYAVDPTTFSNIVDYVYAKNMEVVTIGEGVTRMH